MVEPDWISQLETVDQIPYGPILDELHIMSSPDFVLHLVKKGTGPKAVIQLSSIRTLDMDSIRFIIDWALIRSLHSLARLHLSEEYSALPENPTNFPPHDSILGHYHTLKFSQFAIVPSGG
ncbi:hypothetical protein CVT25_007361 [Psilocybe cyanescens]|uniref:Uncharacterized protein n=1 Tax=Psilocybe cyanescens TaxID=93625 RepID=A0A409XJI2_PSICY|nr:hypothetical protein CVT25_007361 [Psilocybe cyanescens]